MKTRKSATAISLLIIALGIAWLLNVLKIVAGVDWIWVMGLGVSGILLLVFARMDRFNFVVGASLIVCSMLSLLRQTGRLVVNIEAPVLFITVGVLLFLSQILPIAAAETDRKKPTAADANSEFKS